MGNSKTDKNIFQKEYFFLKKYIFISAQIVVAIVSVFVIVKTNKITNTANLLQINDAIQHRQDIVSAVEMKYREYNINGTFDARQETFLEAEMWAAVSALLNAYEFACDQYLTNKIDKKAFKTFYLALIKHIKTKDEYAPHINSRDGKEKYSAIDKVYREWHGDNTH